MLWAIALVLLALGVGGLMTSYTMGGFVQILIGTALIAAFVQIIQDCRVG